MAEHKRLKPWQNRIHEVIFEADTPAGKFFDISLLVFICASVIVVILDSVHSLHDKYGDMFLMLEWIFTAYFTIEYILRVVSVARPRAYIFSFFGIIDFLATIPTYLSLFIAAGHYFVIIRLLRLLRIFRLFKLTRFMKEGRVITSALKESQPKLTVFLFFVMLMVVLFGALMYVIEGAQNEAFKDIPTSIYWAIVTLTTVGYGDISPVTPLGQFISAIVMVMGYAVIAVPTGIIGSEMITEVRRENISSQVCPNCSREGHMNDAAYCKFCGNILN